jgi:hypothetical protein
MQVIDGEKLAKKCDYSFGDQSGRWSGRVPGWYMKDVSLLNTEFATKVFEIKKSRDYMTVFIDNLRLYDRPIADIKEEDKTYIEFLLSKGTLFELLKSYPMMKFIIFTNLEDTPIDEYIFDKIPDNVLLISAVNAISNGGKVIPGPYGLQRKLYPEDERQQYLKSYTTFWPDNPEYLLYVSFMQDSHKERHGIADIFSDNDWAIVDEERKRYHAYLNNIGNSKFVVCPRGNAIDCHRNWEVAYLNRVPILKRDPYYVSLYEWMDYPALFVDDFSEVTKELLIENDHLWQKSWGNSLLKSKLNLDVFFENVIEEALS